MLVAANTGVVGGRAATGRSGPTRSRQGRQFVLTTGHLRVLDMEDFVEKEEGKLEAFLGARALEKGPEGRLDFAGVLSEQLGRRVNMLTESGMFSSLGGVSLLKCGLVHGGI